jgi:hypothetical protein
MSSTIEIGVEQLWQWDAKSRNSIRELRMYFRLTAVILFSVALVSLQAHSTPVVGDSAVFLDDKDPNLFYFHPDRMVLASDSVSKRKKYGCFEEDKIANANASFAFENSEQLSKVLAVIKNSKPNAKFAPLPLRATQFFDRNLPNTKILLCSGSGLTIGSTSACAWQMSGTNVCRNFKELTENPSGLHFMDLSLIFYGIVQGQVKEVTRVIPVIIFGLN